jgi:serine/threonine protein kinase
MALPTSVIDFLQVVRDSGLVDPTDLALTLDRLRNHDQLPAQPRKLAQRLITENLLTPFQAELLLLGHWHVFTIGKYRILDQLGSGSSGVVYLVEQRDLARKVAVKVLPLSADIGPSLIQRFRREARALAVLDHPNIVHVHDFDQDGDKLFLVMEYVEGVTLHEWVKKHGRLDVTHACHYVRQAARGLQAIHEAGLVHRDLKPNNIMLDTTGTVKILDLGLARFLGEEADSPTLKYDSKRVLGTADFLSPEQALNSHDVDIRTDIYGLGATFYFLLAGQTPFPTGTIVQKLMWVQSQPPQPVHEVNPEVPAALGEIVARMMAKAPADRYTTPFEVVRALSQWTQAPIAPPQLGRRPRHRHRLPDSALVGQPPTLSHHDLGLSPEETHDQGDPTPLPSVAELQLPLTREGKRASNPDLPQWPLAADDAATRVDLTGTPPEGDGLSEWIPDGPLPEHEPDLTAAPEPGPAPEAEGGVFRQWALVVVALLFSIALGIALALLAGH